MIEPDIVNSVFQFSAGLFLWNNVRMLVKHKKVQGISVLSIIFFTLWGYWNLFHYPVLHQWKSFVAGIFVVLANTVWVYLAFRYRKLERISK